MTEGRRITVPSELTGGSVASLRDAIRTAPPVLILQGGAEVFCTGLALGDHAAATPDTVAQALTSLVEVFLALAEHPGPTLAIVEGQAAGGGVGLAAACDLVLAGPDATFALPELLLGLTPATIAPFLVQRMGPQSARRLMLDAGAISAEVALARGLIDEVAAPDRLERSVRQIQRRLARLDPTAARDARKLTSAPDLAASLKAGAAETTVRICAPTTQRRIEAFNNGLAPWHGAKSLAEQEDSI